MNIVPNVEYGVKVFRGDFQIVLLPEFERQYRLIDLIWIVPLCVSALAVGMFLGFFYFMFPVQLLWLIPALIMCIAFLFI